MSKELQKQQSNELAHQLTKEEQELIIGVVASGDLKPLTTQQKMQYVLMTCKQQGLNPALAANYYEIIPFQAKEVLYAKKGLAEALRDARNIQCQTLSTNLDKETCLYSVKVRASLPNGRCEEAIGVLSVEVEDGEWKQSSTGKRYFAGNGKYKQARGQDLANLMMKCETKAKRRATLALCGLGIEERDNEQVEPLNIFDTHTLRSPSLDPESEPWNKPVQETENLAEVFEAEFTPSPSSPAEVKAEPMPAKEDEFISIKQRNMFFAVAGKNGWTHEAQKQLLSLHHCLNSEGEPSTSWIRKGIFNELLEIVSQPYQPILKTEETKVESSDPFEQAITESKWAA